MEPCCPWYIATQHRCRLERLEEVLCPCGGSSRLAVLGCYRHTAIDKVGPSSCMVLRIAAVHADLKCNGRVVYGGRLGDIG